MYNMDAREYNQNVMKGYFAEVYPLIAKQIIERTGVSSGVCVDLGSGPGMLGIELARISDLNVTAYDLLEDCVIVAKENISEYELADRMDAVRGMAEDMTYFESGSVDLVASRGSIFFWEDQKKGLNEVSRILKPGGWAYIGGGFGCKELQERIHNKRVKEGNPGLESAPCRKEIPVEEYQKMIDEMGVKGEASRTEKGFWIIFQK